MKWPYSNSIDNTFDNIIQDVLCFANHDSIRPQRKGNDLILEWKDKLLVKKAVFKVNREHNILVTLNSETIPYRTFLASRHMADLSYTSEQLISGLGKIDYLLPTFASLDDSFTPVRRKFDDVIDELINSPVIMGQQIVNATQIIFVRGAAGAGKSIAVKNIARTQAEKYLNGQSDYLYFYIDAQGRALARIDEAIAIETQRFNLTFRFDTVSALARNGLVIPIIDGFDELIGSGGFADAFKSLSSFLVSLRENGSVIATGRSTFYDEKILSYIANTYGSVSSINYHFRTVEILGWTELERTNYFKLVERVRKVDFYTSAERALKHLSTRNETLLSKPFFCAQLADYFCDVLQSNEEEIDLVNFHESDLLTILLNHYISRESDKIRNRSGERVLGAEGHLYFLSELAMELWWQEQRYIDQETLQTVAELAGEHLGIIPEDISILVGKVTSHALLSSEHIGGELLLKFESQAYYDFFLMNALLRLLDQNTERDLRLFMSRSLLGESFIDYFENKYKNEPKEIIVNLLGIFCKTSKSCPVGGLARRNSGSLVCALLRERTDLHSIQVHDIECNKESLSGFMTEGSKFVNCSFVELKIYGASFKDVDFSNSMFYRLHVSDNTSFQGSFLQSGNMVSSIIQESRTYIGYEDVWRKLQELGADLDDSKSSIEFNEVQNEITKLVEIFYTKTRNKLYFDLDRENDPQFNPILSSDYWPMLKEEFVKCRFLTTTTRDRAGRSNVLYRFSGDIDSILECIADECMCSDPNLQRFRNWFYSLG